MARRQPSCQIIGVTNMGTGDRDRLHELFDAALDADESGRIAILAAAEVEDPEMAAELKRLLGKFCEDSAFLESSPFPNMAEMVPDKDDDTWGSDPGDSLPTLDSRPAKTTLGPFREPERVGAYTVLRKIGEGGMGAVYLARQDRPEREVALKLIHRQKVTPSFLARFEREYRVLAMMSHHNIARIFEAGQTEEGDPFFTMEHVDGLPITDYCRRHALDLQNRLRLFVQVCDGVRHAHQKAVVHRDLKPNNILVTTLEGKPVVKLIDFGIAKDLSVEETALQTQTGAFMGTPVYMSPEQIASGGGSDTRSDVYALGVILYELLTGLPPIDPDKLRNRSLFDLLEAYRDTEPPRPSRRLEEAESELALRDFSLELRGDLDWVVMKALDKDIERRYQSPGELEEDLRRYLAGRTVAARPPTITYQLSKFAQRNRVLVGSGLLVFLALITALWVSISANARTTRALERQQQANQYLRDMLSAPDPRRVGMDAKVIDLLESFEAGLSKIEDPIFEAEIRLVLGNTYYGLGDFLSAEKYHRRAVEITRDELGTDDRQTLIAELALARTLRRVGYFDEALSLISAISGTLEKRDDTKESDLLEIREQVAMIAYGMKDYEKARNIYEEIIPRMEALFGPKRRFIYRAYNGYGLCLDKLNQFEEAIDVYKYAYQGQVELLGTDHPETLSTAMNLGNTYRKTGNLDDGVSMMRAAFEGSKRTMGRDHTKTDRAAYSLCYSLATKGYFQEALPIIEETVDVRLEKEGWTDSGTVRALTVLAICQAGIGDKNAAANVIHALLSELPAKSYDALDIPFTMIQSIMVSREIGDLHNAIGQGLEMIIDKDIIALDDLFDLHYELGKALINSDQHDWAADVLCKAWNLYEDRPSAVRTILARAHYGFAIAASGEVEAGSSLIRWSMEERSSLPEKIRDEPVELWRELESLQKPYPKK